MAEVDARAFLERFTAEQLAARGILRGATRLLNNRSVQPLIGLMAEQGVSRLSGLDGRWYLDADGTFQNPRSTEATSGTVASLANSGNVFNEQNTSLNPHYARAPIPAAVGSAESYTPNAVRWDAFVEWARRFYVWEHFEARERNYKLEYGRRLADAREAFLAGNENWSATLRPAITAGGVPHSRFAAIRFVELLNSQPAMIDEALRRIWAHAANAPGEARERIRGFIESLTDAPSDQRIRQPENLASYLLTAHDATQHPYFQVTRFDDAYRLTDYPPHEPQARRWDRYGHAVAFLDEFIAQAADRDLSLRDRLDAQSLVWCVTRTNPEEWDPETLAELDAYRNGPRPPPPPSKTETAPNWPALAGRLLWEPHHLEEIVADLEDKRQMIFYGPPGTGKTYVARAIAEQYAEAGGGWEIVQFHPSYSYEDFVEGFRPTLSDTGQPGFKLTQGPLRRIADLATAEQNPDVRYVLVIDELNRGNVAKVFGELYFLLEYREEAIGLQYGGQPFRLPKNLLFICTMNTADRSIALMDAALRRRFYFAPFFPNEPPIEGLLRRYLDRHSPVMTEHVAGLVDRANERLDRDAAIGPSYFMRKDLDEDRVRRIWNHAVIPYVEEQCFGDEDKLRQLQYDSLMQQAESSATPLDDEEPSTDDDAR